eukprot:4880060-Karenia_brevis.AAC.1
MFHWHRNFVAAAGCALPLLARQQYSWCVQKTKQGKVAQPKAANSTIAVFPRPAASVPAVPPVPASWLNPRRTPGSQASPVPVSGQVVETRIASIPVSSATSTPEPRTPIRYGAATNKYKPLHLYSHIEKSYQSYDPEAKTDLGIGMRIKGCCARVVQHKGSEMYLCCNLAGRDPPCKWSGVL